jgi:hypothetical protein
VQVQIFPEHFLSRKLHFWLEILRVIVWLVLHLHIWEASVVFPEVSEAVIKRAEDGVALDGLNFGFP